MNNFEENLKKLESLTSDIKRSDISLEDALRDFEEGIGLAKELDEPNPMEKDNPPQFDDFSINEEVKGTRK